MYKETKYKKQIKPIYSNKKKFLSRQLKYEKSDVNNKRKNSPPLTEESKNREKQFLFLFSNI
jgi:outer membrane lipopolysaccharide assembly protein LptE/RlpB